MRRCLPLLILLFAGPTAASADSHHWLVTFSNGDTLANIALVEVRGDSLAISRNDCVQLIYIEPIVELRLINEARFGTFVRNGSILGAVIGLIFVPTVVVPEMFDNPLAFFKAVFDELLFAGGGGFIGVISGAVASNDEVHDFSRMSLRVKTTLVKELLLTQ